MSEPVSIKGNFGSFVTGFTLLERTNMPRLSFKAYIQLVEPLAREVETETGINYILPLVQSANESTEGNSKLAKEYGNLFGFKATEGWKKRGNPVANLPTWEVATTENPDNYKKFNPTLIEKYDEAGKHMYKLKFMIPQEFRIYATWRDSFFDWGRLISTVPVYAGAYKLLQNKETFRDGMKKMIPIYANDPKYTVELLALYDKVDSGIF